jgi:hypothetical protein
MLDYNDPSVLEAIQVNLLEIKVHEKFALKVTGEHGCKDFFLEILKTMILLKTL